jgi:malate dehydrogenase (oxaloacetate-decarboxylating)
MPVMEGKCALFKTFGDVDAIPLCIRSKNVDEIVQTVYLLSGSFGGINLEDISAPRCFEIEQRLKQLCDIPVFHDDQHGTATVVLAALINSLKITHKKVDEVTCVINGAGAAGTAICKLLLHFGIKNIIMCDKNGAIVKGDSALNSAKAEIAEITNHERRSGSLADVIKGADIFIGVSAAGVLQPDMIRSMANQPIILALANPVPEIFPDEAKKAGAAVVGTGRSDYPNQINNVLCFPGIFKGALQVRASDINREMQIAAAYAIADFVKPGDLHAEHIIPSPLECGVAERVAQAVAEAAIACKLARV